MNLSIIGNPETIGRRSRDERKADREKRRDERNKGREGKPNRFKKVALAIPRNAFLGLIRLNFRGLATRLSNQIKKDPAKVRAMWLRLGGDPEKLLTPVEKGAKKKRLLGTDENFILINGVGEAATATTLIASAAPIIAVVAKFLKQAGEKEGAGESLDDIQPAPGDEINTDTAAADPETPEAAKKQPTEEKTSPTTTSATSSTMKFSPTTGLIIGAVLIGGFLLMKKKK
jgi:hypothetical protein